MKQNPSSLASHRRQGSRLGADKAQAMEGLNDRKGNEDVPELSSLLFPRLKDALSHFRQGGKGGICCLLRPLSTGHFDPARGPCALKGNPKENLSSGKIHVYAERVDGPSGNKEALKEKFCSECPKSSWPRDLRERESVCVSKVLAS